MPKPILPGVLFYSTPVFLFVFILALPFFTPVYKAYAQASTADQAGSPPQSASQNEPATIFADSFYYEQENERITAIGHVRVWYGNITLTSQEAQADLAGNMLYARGDVVLYEAEREIKCFEMDYNLQSRSATMRGILFASPPWYYQGETVEKEGEDKVTITKARFTTCNSRHPHFYLTAEKIDIVLNDSLTAHHAVLYVGTTPLFYLPWIRRSLKDGRPPFSIRVGYNDFEGFFAKLRFNYFLLAENYGALLLDFMEKKGIGLGLEQHARYALFGGGEGDFSLLYVKDEEQASERWTANLSNRHEFSEKDLLQLNLDYVSDRTFNREFSFNLVDTYQQKSYLSYSHRGEAYYFSVGASNTESLDPVLDTYYPSSRELPTAAFSLSSIKLADIFNPVYFSLNSSWSRVYERLGEEIGDLRYRYRDNFTLAPAFTQTYTFPLQVLTQPSISASLYLPVNGIYLEEYFDGFSSDANNRRASLDTAYTTRVTLTNKWVNYRYTKPTHLMQTRISHEFTRKFPVLEQAVLPRAGVSNHRLGLAADYYMGDFLTLQAGTGYRLLELEEKDRWQDRMDPLTFNGRAQLPASWSLNWQAQHAWDKGRITSAYLSSSTYAKNWNLSMSGSYSHIGLPGQEHSLFGTLSSGYQPGIGVSLRSILQYDFMKKEFTNFSISLSRDLHCWEMQAGFKIYADKNIELGLGLTLKAFPEFKVGMGGPGGVSVGE